MDQSYDIADSLSNGRENAFCDKWVLMPKKKEAAILRKEVKRKFKQRVM